jgi:stage V sporulation protein S
MDKSTIRVAATSDTRQLAGSICHQLREHDQATVQAVGAGATHQALKALIVAQGFMEFEDKALTFKPYFIAVQIDGHELTGIGFDVICKGDKHECN